MRSSSQVLAQDSKRLNPPTHFNVIMRKKNKKSMSAMIWDFICVNSILKRRYKFCNIAMQDSNYAVLSLLLLKSVFFYFACFYLHDYTYRQIHPDIFVLFTFIKRPLKELDVNCDRTVGGSLPSPPVQWTQWIQFLWHPKSPTRVLIYPLFGVSCNVLTRVPRWGRLFCQGHPRDLDQIPEHSVRIPYHTTMQKIYNPLK